MSVGSLLKNVGKIWSLKVKPYSFCLSSGVSFSTYLDVFISYLITPLAIAILLGWVQTTPYTHLAHVPGPLTAGLPCALTEVLWSGWAGSLEPADPIHSRWAAQGTVVSPLGPWITEDCACTPPAGGWGWHDHTPPGSTQSLHIQTTLSPCLCAGPCQRHRVANGHCFQGLRNRELRTPPGEGGRSGSCVGQSRRVVLCPVEPHLESLNSRMKLWRTWRGWGTWIHRTWILSCFWFAGSVQLCGFRALWSNTCLSALVSFPGGS